MAAALDRVYLYLLFPRGMKKHEITRKTGRRAALPRPPRPAARNAFLLGGPDALPDYELLETGPVHGHPPAGM
jgi:hypothetical protein